MNITDLKRIVMMDIDLSNEIRYSAVINNDTLVQYKTDGFFRKHLTKEEFIEFIIYEYKKIKCK